ncbi:MAG: nucleotidyltransferase family protein [Bacteroidia bacterium]|nr:nucleotidyltransferase family protein [Bacteroidia bacterium]
MTKKSIRIGAILLAAGSSSRLGQPKQLLRYKGDFLINYILRILDQDRLEEVAVILGANKDLILSILPGSTTVIQNESWQQGMGTSISTGVEYFKNKVDGILICLVDQYRINSAVVNDCIRAFATDPSKVVACRYDNKIKGPPVIFPKSYFNQLSILKGSIGARKIIKSISSHSPTDMILISFPEGYLDIDIPKDLEKL